MTTSKRSYGQNCALALAGDVLCERWTLLILRELLIQPCRFGQLTEWLKGIGTNLLTDRLKELEAAQLVKKLDAGRQAPYTLTEHGRAVEPVITAMIRWGHESLTGDKNFTHQAHWDLLAMRALYQPDQKLTSLIVQFDAPTLCASVTANPKELQINMGMHPDPDIVINKDIVGFQKAIKAGKYKKNLKVTAFIKCFNT